MIIIYLEIAIKCQKTQVATRLKERGGNELINEENEKVFRIWLKKVKLSLRIS